uniref:Cytochrome c biogenesis protein CcsB n=1 Tax=Erythroglossum lusitanicum TaxID=2575615 RepID=A0A4D6WST9_9FLOR|nr:cytochrome c biogenesis protein ccs1 [Erythroglossum lusitanicum]
MNILNIKNMIWNFFKKIATLNFSIFILLLISIFSMLGSFIEQNQTIFYYQTYYPVINNKFLFLNWKLIMNLGLDHLYQTWWFNLIVIIFAFSLIICTFSTQLPSLRNARRWKFIHSKYPVKLNNSLIFSSNLLNHSSVNMIYSLMYCNFYVFHKKKYIYAYKGILGRIAPIFVHFSMIIILLGTVCSLFYGFVTQEMIPNGEVFHLKNIVNAGSYSSLPKNLVGHVDNFFINYNIDNSIKQFFSEISFFDQKGEFFINKVISVNSPLNFKGITFYQTDWEINALRFKLGHNVCIQKKLVKIDIGNKIFWICSLPISFNKNIIFIIVNLKNQILIYDMNGSFINNIDINKKFYINKIPIKVIDIMTSTGLQIKIDPGVFVVYLGFFILMSSSLISYISYSQIWVNITSSIFNLTGSTNRAILFFEEDIGQISQIYSEYTFIKSQKLILKQNSCDILRK